MTMKYTAKNGKLRIYEGNTTTARYLEIIFSGMDLNAPIGAPVVEEQLILDRLAMGSNAHYIEGSDARLMEPVPVSFGVMVTDITAYDYLMDWIEGNTVNSYTILTTKQDTKRDGTNFNPAFRDSGKKTCNVELAFQAALAGTDEIVYHWNEVYFDPSQCNLRESPEGSNVTLSGMCYGTISRDTAFSTGGTAV